MGIESLNIETIIIIISLALTTLTQIFCALTGKKNKIEKLEIKKQKQIQKLKNKIEKSKEKAIKNNEKIIEIEKGEQKC